MTIEQTLAHAISLHQSGRLADAEALYRQILAHDRQQPAALHFLGLIAFQRGRVNVAAEFVEQSVAARPTEPLPWRNLATIYKAAGRLPEALAAADRALALNPAFLDAALARAEILTALGRVEDAISAYTQLLTTQPQHPTSHQRLAEIYQAHHQPEPALRHLLILARLQPGDPQWPAQAAALHAAAGRFRDAEPLLHTALALAPDTPGYLRALADVQLRQSHRAAAQATLEKLIVRAPGDLPALETLGQLLEAHADYGQALSTYTLALQVQPDHAPTHTRLAHLLLRAGEFQRGWEELAWPFLTPPNSPARAATLPPSHANVPLWDGTVLFSKRILLHSAGSPSDLILFLRYAAVVHDLGGTVVLECPRAFERLLVNIPAIAETLDPGESPGPIDTHCPLPVVPHLLHTTLDTIPNRPYLHADPDLAHAWSARIHSATTVSPARTDHLAPSPDAPAPFNIGVVWRADNETLPFDSFGREILASLLKTATARFFSLQRGDAGGIVAPPAGFSLIDLTADIHDFADLAALIANLHLVIGFDAAPAHLAAAMGIPTWLLLPPHAHWCWLTHRPDSPFYPSVRLFRPRS